MATLASVSSPRCPAIISDTAGKRYCETVTPTMGAAKKLNFFSSSTNAPRVTTHFVSSSLLSPRSGSSIFLCMLTRSSNLTGFFSFSSLTSMIAMVVQFENKSQHERGLELYLALGFGVLDFNACLICGRHVRQFFQHLRMTVEFDLVS